MACIRPSDLVGYYYVLYYLSEVWDQFGHHLLKSPVDCCLGYHKNLGIMLSHWLGQRRESLELSYYGVENKMIESKYEWEAKYWKHQEVVHCGYDCFWVVQTAQWQLGMSSKIYSTGRSSCWRYWYMMHDHKPQNWRFEFLLTWYLRAKMNSPSS